MCLGAFQVWVVVDNGRFISMMASVYYVLQNRISQHLQMHMIFESHIMDREFVKCTVLQVVYIHKKFHFICIWDCIKIANSGIIIVPQLTHLSLVPHICVGESGQH